MAQSKQVGKGWFVLPGRQGDRTFEQQLMGLDWLFSVCRGKSILDAGCAEGLIAHQLARVGAGEVHGVEMRPDAVKVAKDMALDLWQCTFEVGDLNTWRPRRAYDIVIGLAILHKLKDPSAVAAALAEAAREAVVWRLPPATAPIVIDDRSGRKRHDIGAVMFEAGFRLLRESRDGPFGEWIGVYVRG